jgi:hypothetical protein
MLDLFSSENSKKAILLFVIVALGISMAARKQFVTNTGELFYTHEYSVVEGHEKELGHIHPLFRKDAFAPPGLMIPYSLHFTKNFHIFSPMLHWILVIALMTLVIRQTGLDRYCSIVLTMLVLFFGGIVAREIFNIPLIGPAPSIGYQSFDYRILITPLTLASILSIFRGRLILSGLILGLTTIIHIKFGMRLFSLLMGCIILWNILGWRLVREPRLRIPWKLVAGFSSCWIIQFVSWYLYVQNKLHLFAEIDVPRVTTPFLSRLGWLVKSEPDDYMISYLFRFNGAFFGFLFLAISTIALCELIRRRLPDVRAKIMAVILMLSVFIALLFFGCGFLFETLFIDHLPLSFSTMITLARVWDLIWVVPTAFTIAAFMSSLVWVEDLCRKFQKDPFVMRKFFLHTVFLGFVLFNLYIFVYEKDGSIYTKPILGESPVISFPYTQICTKDTVLYQKTVDKLWKLAASQSEGEFYENLQILETIFDRTLTPSKIKTTNNPDVRNLRVLYNLKSNRYSLASRSLGTRTLTNEGFDSNDQTGMHYFWSCDNKKFGIHRERIEIPFHDFYDISQWINKNTPFDRGVIAPPYLTRFSVYSSRVDFYDSKRDGHVGYMVKDYYHIALHRLQTLAGPYAPIIEPGIRAGQFGMRGRAYFLSLRQEDFLSIRRSYPHYDFLVTENQGLLGFPKLYSNASFAVYNISD